MAVYDDIHGRTFVRPLSMFYDTIEIKHIPKDKRLGEWFDVEHIPRFKSLLVSDLHKNRFLSGFVSWGR